MARVTLGSGETITIGGTTDVFGTTGEQTINVLDGSTVNFRGGFNSGETDTIRLNGNASDFVISAVGLTVTLFSAVDNIRIVLPIGANGANIVFDNGDTRTITREGANGTKIDDQLITGTPVALSEGLGVYEVTSSGEVLEGGVLTFTVTRTDTSTAETLQATAVGFTNGGTIVAAQQGDDFTVAGATLTFAVGQASRTFTISAPLDAVVEGVEGIRVNVIKGGNETVATTTALILDGTPEGQTFQLTSGLDTVGTGVPTDLVGSGGNTGTGGNDTIVAVTGEVSLLNPNLGLTGTLTPFDNINGGAGDDTLLVLDNGNPFTSAPNFTGVTVDNVESLDYRAPTRGFLGGAFNVNTAGFDGLENASFFINGGGTQTITLDDETTSTAANGITQTDVNTSAIVNQIGNGDLVINGGGDSLVVTAAGGDVTVGGTTASNSYDTVVINGGDNIFVTDQGSQQLPSVVVSGVAGDINVRGSAVTAIGISNIGSGTDIDVDVNALAQISLSQVDAGGNNVNIESQGNISVLTDGTVEGLADIISKGTRVELISNGNLELSDINVLGANATVSIVANGNVALDNIDGGFENGVPNVFGNGGGSSANDVRNVNLSGTGSVTMTDVQQASNLGDTKTTITSTNVPGGVTIFSQLGNDTLFNGSANTGNDDITFGATTEDNSFGGGTDRVTFNANAFGTTGGTGTSGSFDGGESAGDDDRLVMESNNAATFTGTAQQVVNFEHLELAFQTIAKGDVINLANIGMNDISNVTSDVGDGSVAQVTTLSFTGTATSAPVTGDGDTIVFSGPLGALTPIELVDGDNATTIANKVRDAINTQLGATFTATALNGVVTVVNDDPGATTSIVPANITFVDGTSVGTPGLEQGVPFVQINQGVTPVAAAQEQQTLILEDVTLLNGETLTFTWDPDGAGGLAARTFSYLNNTGANLTQNGGALAEAIIAAANNNSQAGIDFDQVWVATRVGNNVLFTATGAFSIVPPQLILADGNRPLIEVTGFNANDLFEIEETVMGVTPVTGEREIQTFVLDGVASGNDTLTFDGVTITFDDGMTPAQLAARFAAQYVGPDRIWEVINVTGSAVTLRSFAQGNLPPLTSADFVFGDDTNIGDPDVAVAVTTLGTDASVTLNNFISTSTLTLTNTNGNHTVNMKTDTGSDVLNLVLATDGDHGLVTVERAETVNIDTSGDTGSDTLDLFGGDLTTLVVVGSDDLDLNTNSTIISSIDASGLGGFFDWEADANSVNITVRTGSGGSDVDFSGILLGGGQAAGSSARITFIGGSGDDFVTTGDQGTARGTIRTGAGDDVIFVGVVDGGNDFWSITDFDVDFDKLDFANPTSGFTLDQELEELTATFQDYLDQAARGLGDGTIRYFYWQGDTYVVQDNADGEDFSDGTDTVIRIQGEVELTADNFV